VRIWGHAWDTLTIRKWRPVAKSQRLPVVLCKATTGIEPVDRSNRSVEPNIDLLLLLLMIKRHWRS
jgi:hypothetical protein